MSQQQQQHHHHQHHHHQHHHHQKHSKNSRNHEEYAPEEEQYDPLANLLSLQLRKPAHWNWELSTSRSCTNIALPRILLYDHTGALLLDADGNGEQTYRSSPVPERVRKRAATVNLEKSLAQAHLPSELDNLYIGEVTPSDTPLCASPTRQQVAGSCIDFSTHELPDWKSNGHSSSSRRSSSLRGVRFEEMTSPLIGQEVSYPTPPSTSTLTTTANSSSSGPREKRSYRRSHSSGQRSILERFSMSRGRHSSPEYAQEQMLEAAPRYYLRSSKAGTLVIKDDSFSRVRQRRRRPKHSSSENMLAQQQQGSAENVVQVTAQRRQHYQRPRERQPLLSTSEEEELEKESIQGQSLAGSTRQSRCRRTPRNCAKDVAAQEFITVDPANSVYRGIAGATAR